MKRILLLLGLAVSITTTAHTDHIKNVGIEELTMELRDGKISVHMELNMEDLKVKGTQVVLITPYIINGSDSLALKSIGIYGRNRHFFYLRNDKTKPTSDNDIEYRKSEIDNRIEYKDSVRFNEWMDGCRLTITRSDYGCCNKSTIISSSNLVKRFPLQRYFPQLIYLRPEHEVVKAREISGSAYVDFPVSRIEIYPEYRNNVIELSKITSTIDSVKNDNDITIKEISIKGYASPESPYSNNAYLAKGRTESLKKYVQSLYNFNDDLIKTSYEPEDWKGLERFVEASKLPHKAEILAAIRTDLDPDKKEWRIKSRYKEDYRFLLDNCYPALRHSDYKIEYTIRSYTDTLEIERIFHSAPQKLSLEEFYILAQTYEPGSEEFEELFETAVRMYPEDPAANLNAANSAIIKKDYKKALRYLDKAGDLPEAIYARGALEVYMEEDEAARPYLEQAKESGIQQADTTLIEISKNRMIYRMNNNK